MQEHGKVRELYPDAGLADLLVTSPDADAEQTIELYREAIDD